MDVLDYPRDISQQSLTGLISTAVNTSNGDAYVGGQHFKKTPLPGTEVSKLMKQG